MTKNNVARYEMYIGGEFAEGDTKEYFESVNPATGEVWSQIPRANSVDINKAIQAARQCFDSQEWRSLSPTKRGRLLRKLGEEIGRNAEYLAKIEIKDNGKLFREMYAQLKAIPAWFEYFGGLADKIESSVIPLDKQSVLNYTLYEPLGVVACITPWNSPLLLAIQKIAPAIAAGNTIVLKPSEHTSASALELAKLFDKVGFPKGALNIVTGYGYEIGDTLTKHPGINKVAFTGGTEVGIKVGMNAMSHLAPATLELGGKSPNIVFSDANLDAAEAGVISGIYAAGGQTCIAGSRLFVEDSIADEFLTRLVNKTNQIKLGDPSVSDTQMGPVATLEQLKKIESYVDIARSEGTEVLTGGDRPEDPELSNGWFYSPTILSNVDNSMRIAQEEVFGPVLSVIRFHNEEEVINMANDSRFGLGAGIWTNNLKRAHRMARSIESGIVWINTYRATAFNSPFGGYKSSGIGRENSKETIYEYLQTKSVWIELSDEVNDPFSIKI